MNYASFRIAKAKVPAVLTKLVLEIKARFPKFEPSFEIEKNFGKIIFKDDCLMPFYIDNGKITFASVDYHGLRRHSEPASIWKKYASSFMCLDGYTYLTARTKMLLCNILDQSINDEGIGKYREDPDEAKFQSLENWRAEQSKNPPPDMDRFVKADAKISLAQDKEYLPELI